MEKLNWILWKLTWSSLIVGSVDHFIIEILPAGWASWNLVLLWILVVATLASEGAAYLIRRRAAGQDDGSDG